MSIFEYQQSENVWAKLAVHFVSMFIIALGITLTLQALQWAESFTVIIAVTLAMPLADFITKLFLKGTADMDKKDIGTLILILAVVACCDVFLFNWLG